MEPKLKWFLDEKTPSLVLLDEQGSEHFYVPIEELKDSKGVLWWVAEISQKQWPPEVRIGFIRALDLALDLQENYCPADVGPVDPVKTMNGVKRFWTWVSQTLAKSGHDGHFKKGGMNGPQV